MTIRALLAIFLLASSVYAGEVSGRVTAAGAAGARMIVYVERVEGAPVVAPEHPKLTQRNTEFAPGELVVTQGQKIDFPNEDKFFHNVFSATEGNEFDLGLYRGGASKSVEMKEPGEVEVFCNIHPNMAAKILVLQNNYYAQVKPDGSFSIAGVPPGSYTLVAWSGSHQPERHPLKVTGAAPVKVNFKLKLRDDPKLHLNKNGEQYGRYK